MSGRQHVWEGRKPLPLDLMAQAIPMLSRHDLAALADRLIDAIDTCDGDDDLEAEDELLETSVSDDAELDDELLEDDADDTVSLDDLADVPGDEEEL